jgi:hypothetical protein
MWRLQSCPEPGVGAGAAGTCGAPEAALCRETGVAAQVTHGGPGAVLSREAGTTPPPPLPARDTWHPRSCPEPGGGYHSIAPSSGP